MPWLIDLDALAMISFRKARGIRNTSPLLQNHRIRKSHRKERTYRKLLYARWYLEEIANLSSKAAHRWKTRRKWRKDLVLKVRYGDFTTLTADYYWRSQHERLSVINRSASTYFSRNRIPDKYRNPSLASPWPISSYSSSCLWWKKKKTTSLFTSRILMSKRL